MWKTLNLYAGGFSRYFQASLFSGGRELYNDQIASFSTAYLVEL